MASDTPLFSRRNQQGGTFSILDRDRVSQGNVWWVGSTTVVACAYDEPVSHGRSPDAPFATLVYAETRASTNDTIYVLPGHTETIGTTGAAAITLDVAGLRVIGLGGRTRRPNLLVDAYTDTYISITGADTLFQNFIVTAGHSNIASGMIVAGDGVVVRDCDFIQNTADENFLECITDGDANTCDRLTITNCEFCQYDTSGTAGIQIDAAQDRLVITDNIFQGDWGTGAISIGGDITYGFIARNLVYNAATDNDSVITVAAAGTGICAFNAGGNGAAAANQITATAMALAENYGGVSAADSSLPLDPVVTTLGD